MSSRITFGGIATEDKHALKDQNGNLIKVGVDSNYTYIPAYGFPKDITENCDVRDLPHGVNMSWKQKKAVLHNPVNFSDWITNVQRFLVSMDYTS